MTTIGSVPIGQTITDWLGNFFFPDLGPATYELDVSAIGYQNTRETVYLTIGPNPGVQVSLQPKQSEQPPVLVEPASVDDYQIPKEAREQYKKGIEQFRQRHWQESRASFEEAVRLYPRFASAQAGLGAVLLQQRDLPGAQQAFEAAVEINPNYALPRLYLGGIYNAEQRFQEALEQLTTALTLRADFWLGHFEISRSYWGLGDVANAEVHIVRAHELQKRVPQVHLMLANIYLVREDYPAALREMDECLELLPRGPLAEHVRQRRGQVQEKLAKATGR